MHLGPSSHLPLNAVTECPVTGQRDLGVGSQPLASFCWQDTIVEQPFPQLVSRPLSRRGFLHSRPPIYGGILVACVGGRAHHLRPSGSKKNRLQAGSMNGEHVKAPWGACALLVGKSHL